MAETITVSGASPFVDTTSTATSNGLTREQLEVLRPLGMGFTPSWGRWRACARTWTSARPGWATGRSSGSTDGRAPRGYCLKECGVGPHPPRRGGPPRGLQRDRRDARGDGGQQREMPRRGLLVDSVIKSGGNDFHRTAVVYGWGGALEGDNIDDTLAAQGIKLAEPAHGARLRRHLWRPDRPEQALVLRRRPVSDPLKPICHFIFPTW